MTSTVELSIRCSSTSWGERVGLVGSTFHLGLWGTKLVHKLSPSYPIWQLTLQLPACCEFEYKYVILRGDDIVRWEDCGTNRTFKTALEGGVLTIDDGDLGLRSRSSSLTVTPTKTPREETQVVYAMGESVKALEKVFDDAQGEEQQQRAPVLKRRRSMECELDVICEQVEEMRARIGEIRALYGLRSKKKRGVDLSDVGETDSTSSDELTDESVEDSLDYTRKRVDEMQQQVAIMRKMGRLRCLQMRSYQVKRASLHYMKVSQSGGRAVYLATGIIIFTVGGLLVLITMLSCAVEA